MSLFLFPGRPAFNLGSGRLKGGRVGRGGRSLPPAALLGAVLVPDACAGQARPDGAAPGPNPDPEPFDAGADSDTAFAEIEPHAFT